MNVKIWAEAALFPEKEYISGIFVAVQIRVWLVQPIKWIYWERPMGTPDPTLQCQKSNLCIPRNETAQQITNSYIQFIYSQDRSVYLAAPK